MKPNKRMGANDAETRSRLITAALEILSSDGIAAVTAGRIAEMGGLKRQIVHYYFGTIDDLLAEVVRHA